MKSLTLARAVSRASARLRRAGIPQAVQEVHQLLSLTLHRDKTFLFAHPEYCLTRLQEKTFNRLVLSRARHMPMAYLTGQCDFYDLSLAVDGRVLIPRPETEILAEQMIKKYQGRTSLKLLDLGTGSGCLALALAKHLKARVWAVEKSAPALALARRNAKKLKLSQKVFLEKGDLFSPFSAGRYQKYFDGIVSNPPYIPTKNIAGLMPEVKKEPRLALDGGPDGLACLRRIVSQAGFYLKPGGWLGLEIGIGQRKRTELMLEKNGFEVECYQDTQGLDRVLLGRKKKS